MNDLADRLRMRPDSDCREAADEIERLRAQLAAAEANLEWTNEVNGKLIEQVGELQDRLEAANDRGES